MIRGSYHPSERATNSSPCFPTCYFVDGNNYLHALISRENYVLIRSIVLGKFSHAYHHRGSSINICFNPHLELVTFENVTPLVLKLRTVVCEHN